MFLLLQPAPQIPELFSKQFCPEHKHLQECTAGWTHFGCNPSNLWLWQCSSKCISGLKSGSFFLLEMCPNSPLKLRQSRKKELSKMVQCLFLLLKARAVQKSQLIHKQTKTHCVSPDNYNKMIPGTTIFSFLSNSLLDHDLFLRNKILHLSPATQQAQK